MAGKQQAYYDVSIGILFQLIHYLKHLGIDYRCLLAECGIDPALTEDAEARIAFSAYIAVQEAAATAAGDPFFGLHMGEFIEPGHYSIIGYMMMNSRTLGEAMAEANAYYQILGTAVKTQVRPGLGSVKVLYTLPSDAPRLSYHCYDAMMASVVTLARKLTGTRIHPQEVGVSRQRPDSQSEYERVFACPVRFGQAHNYLVLELRHGTTPIVQPNLQLHDYFAHYAARYLEKLAGHNRTGQAAIEAIHNQMGKQKITVRTIAAELAMSVRTLQARLNSEGIIFSELLLDIRQDLARSYLQQGYMTGEIACLLGYSDTAGFAKAFKRWTGMTPRECREQQLNPQK